MDTFLIAAALLALVTQLDQVTSHGMLLNPPSRNSAWRFGFPNPADHNDNELFCGGFVTHQLTNDGKCGLCGDNWKQPEPRSHETGGKFGNAIVTRSYYSGQIITVVVELTANHKGYFVFKICSILHYKRECEDQSLMNRNVLPIVYPNGTLARKYLVGSGDTRGTFEMKVLLPAGFNCTRCCFQWTYTAGNSWGICEDGKGGLGCGRQETYVNCADVTITPPPYDHSPSKTRAYYLDPRLTSTSRGNRYRLYYRDLSRSGAPMTALSVRFPRCCAVTTGTNITTNPGQDEACQSRCLQYPPNCPTDLCKCVVDVRAREEFKKVQDMADQWCLDRCYVSPAPNCDETKCEVFYTKSP